MERKIKVKALQNSPFLVSEDPNDEIDSGSYAKVVKAFNKENLSEQLVAKIISCKDEETAATIVSEIQILKKIPYHVNLVNCLKIQLSSQNNFYLIMEYCNGGNLEKFLKSNKHALSQEQIKEFLIQFCEGYRVLLQNGIIHRDIKPQNILLHNNIFKIADFGFAKILDPQKIKTNINLSLKGTPLYMAPQIFFEKEGSAKIDMFSLGIVLYRMAYKGNFPFYDPKKFYSSSEDYYKKMMGLQLVIPENNRSKELNNIILKMLVKDKQGRMSWDELFKHPYLKTSQIKNPLYQSQMSSSLEIKRKIQITNFSVIKPEDQPDVSDNHIYEDQITIQEILQKNSAKSEIYQKLYSTKKAYSLIEHASRKLLKLSATYSNSIKKILKKVIVAGLQYGLYQIQQLEDMSGNWQIIRKDIQTLENIFSKDRDILTQFLLSVTDKIRFIQDQYQHALYELFVEYPTYKESVKKQLIYCIRFLLDVYDYLNHYVSTQEDGSLQKFITQIEQTDYDELYKQVTQRMRKRGLLLC